MSDRLLSISQLAARWGWERQRLYRLIHAQQIPFLKLPNGYYFREAEVEAWLQSKSCGPVLRAAAQTPPRRRARTRAEECAELGIEPEHQFT